jgi:D-3-phosphoglycerate dehydrogenase
MNPKTSFPKGKMRVLLLERVSAAAEEVFSQSGYQVDRINYALSGEELEKELKTTHVLGIRSKSQVSSQALARAKNLLCIGCFCIGTDQVDLEAAASAGIAVFNAPFSNTRSVAELVIAEMIMLSRKASERSMEMHAGIWKKSAEGCHELRGRSIGIVGYGHIGPQVGLLAEAFGMRVSFFDISKRLPLGNAQATSSLDELLETSDFVTLHVPDTELTREMISASEISRMKPSSVLLNLSRGKVVDLKALKAALESGHLSGAAVDVFPDEPESNDDVFEHPLCGMKNVILTPHVGGSTEEAQWNIGVEVASALVGFLDIGSTAGSVNFPEVDLPRSFESHRLLNIHRNVPGVLRDINAVIAGSGANIQAQYLSTQADIGYLIVDVGSELSKEVKKSLDELESTIRNRLLY